MIFFGSIALAVLLAILYGRHAAEHGPFYFWLWLFVELALILIMNLIVDGGKLI